MKKDYITVKIDRKVYEELTKDNILFNNIKIKTVSNLIKDLIRKNKECQRK